MQFDFTDEQLIMLLEVLGQYHMVQYMQGKDNEDTEKIIEVIAIELTNNGKSDIFNKVFREYIKKGE
jgi:hypothetical protein